MYCTGTMLWPPAENRLPRSSCNALFRIQTTLDETVHQRTASRVEMVFFATAHVLQGLQVLFGELDGAVFDELVELGDTRGHAAEPVGEHTRASFVYSSASDSAYSPCSPGSTASVYFSSLSTLPTSTDEDLELRIDACNAIMATQAYFVSPSAHTALSHDEAAHECSQQSYSRGVHKPKRQGRTKRPNHSPRQTRILEEWVALHPEKAYLTHEEVDELAARTNLDRKQVSTAMLPRTPPHMRFPLRAIRQPDVTWQVMQWFSNKRKRTSFVQQASGAICVHLATRESGH